MPIQETITIINNSGKIISTGKHLVNIFKDAKAAYKDKKDALKAERGAAPGIRRAQTFDVAMPRRGGPAVEYYEYGPDDYYDDHVYDCYDASDRRRSHDDGTHSLTSSYRSHRGPRSSHHHRSASQSRPALTESNLRTHSEVSGTAPSAAPQTYRSPYAETAPRDMALSRPSLHHAATTSVIHPRMSPAVAEAASPVPTPRQSMLVHRPRSDQPLFKKSKEIDLNLAYGNIPPDLASRVDLDVHHDYDTQPATGIVSPITYQDEEQEARGLMARIEAFLDEAHCVHHSATAIIAHLQGNPEAAAAVALTLAELSALLGKLSPGFLGVVKGGSPAVFALLASPQFLIGAGVAVGVTIVMFGGWKIVKRIREEARKDKEQQAMAFEMRQPAGPGGAVYEPFVPAAYGGGVSAFDEALVLEEELSTIESWRRGIVPCGEDETADLELISPEAERRRREDEGDGIAPDDSASRSGRTERSSRTHRTSKTGHRSGHHHHRSSRRRGDGDQDDIPERKSSKGFKDREGGDDETSSHRSHRSSRSKKTQKLGLKAIEDGSKDAGNTLDSVLQKDKKPNMLKTMFKKKKAKEDKEKIGVSVLV